MRSADRLRVAASNLAVDAVTIEIVSALEQRGISAMILKGPSIAQWLYPPGGRLYSDVDLLIPPADIDHTHSVLAARGYEPVEWRFDFVRPQAATPWKLAGSPSIDVHTHLAGARADHAAQWEALRRESESIVVAGRPIPCLGIRGRLLFIGLHTALEGPRRTKPLADLQRAVEVVPLDKWQEAAALAQELDAVQAFSAGLRRTPEGVGLAARIGLPPPSVVEVVVLSEAADEGPPLGLQQLFETKGVVARARLIGTTFAPPPEFMRARYGLAARGGLGLALSYALRPFFVLPRLLFRGIPVWLRARRRSRRGH
jgi:hypothetical protein